MNAELAVDPQIVDKSEHEPEVLLPTIFKIPFV